jgi:predicted enzyme related to lactoylglutathione lyase
MPQATGLGGVFLRSRDPKALYAWYEKHLGLPLTYGSFVLPAENQRGPIALAFFSDKADYFPPAQPVMLNFQVDDLEGLLTKLAAEGVAVDSKRETADYGKFGWFTDPEGNRVELWEPTESPAKQ